MADDEIARLLAAVASDADETPAQVKVRLLQIIAAMGDMVSDEEKQAMRDLLADPKTLQ